MKNAAEEECGVWLDTVELKLKAKQKRLARPISKLLNPFTRGGGYSLAVALNFTQTKMEMPKTKQSSISSFFTCQPKVLHDKFTCEEPNMDPVQSSSAATVTASTSAAPGTKRRRGAFLEQPDSEPDVAQEWKTENVPQATHCPEICSQSEEEQTEEMNPPQSKRRFTDTSSFPGDSQPPLAWSQDPLLDYRLYSDSEFYPLSQKNTSTNNFNDSEPSFLNCLQSEEAVGFQIDLKRRTSTQKSIRHFSPSPHLEDEKENRKYSPNKHSSFPHVEPLSNHKWAEPKMASPQKHFKGKRAQNQQSQVVMEDSLATLFTQDSEGFRVIAHRGLQARSPLKERNSSTGVVRTCIYKSLEEEEVGNEMLFTQDSQGNMVMKH